MDNKNNKVIQPGLKAATSLTSPLGDTEEDSATPTIVQSELISHDLRPVIGVVAVVVLVLLAMVVVVVVSKNV